MQISRVSFFFYGSCEDLKKKTGLLIFSSKDSDPKPFSQCLKSAETFYAAVKVLRHANNANIRTSGTL